MREATVCSKLHIFQFIHSFHCLPQFGNACGSPPMRGHVFMFHIPVYHYSSNIHEKEKFYDKDTLNSKNVKY